MFYNPSNSLFRGIFQVPAFVESQSHFITTPTMKLSVNISSLSPVCNARTESCLQAVTIAFGIVLPSACAAPIDFSPNPSAVFSRQTYYYLNCVNGYQDYCSETYNLSCSAEAEMVGGIVPMVCAANCNCQVSGCYIYADEHGTAVEKRENVERAPDAEWLAERAKYQVPADEYFKRSAE
jgi:hypothetical protein